MTVGSLDMQASSVLNISLGAPSSQAAVRTDTGDGGNGNLNLNGTLNLTPTTGFGTAPIGCSIMSAHSTIAV